MNTSFDWHRFRREHINDVDVPQIAAALREGMATQFGTPMRVLSSVLFAGDYATYYLASSGNAALEIALYGALYIRFPEETPWIYFESMAFSQGRRIGLLPHWGNSLLAATFLTSTSPRTSGAWSALEWVVDEHGDYSGIRTTSDLPSCYRALD